MYYQYQAPQFNIQFKRFSYRVNVHHGIRRNNRDAEGKQKPRNH